MPFNKNATGVVLAGLLLIALTGHAQLAELNARLARGWNTWNTRSVLSYVLLPQYIALNLELKNEHTGEILSEALIGRRDGGGRIAEKIVPGDHAYDGSYTSLEIEWRGSRMRVQTATSDNDLVVLVTPVVATDSINLIVTPGTIWGKSGSTRQVRDGFVVTTDDATVRFYVAKNNKTIISTGRKRSLEEIQHILDSARAKLELHRQKYAGLSGLYAPMQRVLAWDVIYEPTHKRVIAPVSRLWSSGGWGGWVLFDWDTYFAAYMLSLDDKDLAYANAIAITHERTPAGFIPNFASGISKSDDRSQPPVGSLVIRELYKKYHEKWLLAEVFDDLLSWNRWWDAHRQLDNFLCWGSDPYTPGPSEPAWLTSEVNKVQAAKWESGLDNSPMYDSAAYDSTRHLMLLADVGLMSLYVNDCRALAEIAQVLGKTDIVAELSARKEKYSKSLQSLWDDQTGMFLNKDLVTGRLSHRLSPTNFYPLLAGVATAKQASRMISEHLFNPDEFAGTFVIPSIARDDPAFKDQNYWRGRIWAPMNFLVYLGLRKYHLTDAQKYLVDKSAKLILQSWTSQGAVYENYNGIDGRGDDVANSDKFYHWGALLSFISFIEKGYVPAPEAPISGPDSHPF